MAVDGEGGILREWVVTLVLNARRLVTFALLLALDQVVLINVVGRLLSGRLGTTSRVTLAHHLGTVWALSVLSSWDVTSWASSRGPDSRVFAGNLLYGGIQISAPLQILLKCCLNTMIDHSDTWYQRDLLLTYLLLGWILARHVLAWTEIGRDLLLNDCVLWELTELFLRVWVSNRMIVGYRLVYFLYLTRIVFYVLEYLIRVLWFWIFLVLLADWAGCGRDLGNLLHHDRICVNDWAAYRRLLARTLLSNGSHIVVWALLVCPLDGSE